MYDYMKQLRWAKLKVGLVITIAILVVFLAIMFAGNIEKMFAPRVEIYASFDDVKGLREGSPVWFSGVEIGAVKDIQFTIQRDITVDMIIFKDTLQYLKRDSLAQILTLGLLGDKDAVPDKIRKELLQILGLHSEPPGDIMHANRHPFLGCGYVDSCQYAVNCGRSQFHFLFSLSKNPTRKVY